ncbi:2617_t:CDS:2 [Paraglomus occultum]|uniref:2617_t:CDS:1 n=1 Tax=Paraglomus occultum TaxID=144539 RepID=A0A9N8Z3R1_9GLOM|nr:2617_t:CDS:2 [Paraglomus occultum]
MAETVQYYLERMVPELEDLEQKRLFNKSEIKQIVKRRTYFEYTLKRIPARKVDFLRYIEYEINLEALRKKRKERLGVKGKPTLSDYAIPRRIYHLFERAVNKFKSDLSLWLQYIEYAKSNKAGKLLNKIFGRALQLHPAKPSLWVLAAKWEFEENMNVGAARVLMQRGLRLNPTSTLLWHEYFSLELAYVKKIKTRREILGLSTTASKDEIQQTDEENVIKLPVITKEDEWFKDKREDVQMDEQKIESLKEENNKVLQGELAKIVYLNAIAGTCIPRL